MFHIFTPVWQIACRMYSPNGSLHYARVFFPLHSLFDLSLKCEMDSYKQMYVIFKLLPILQGWLNSSLQVDIIWQMLPNAKWTLKYLDFSFEIKVDDEVKLMWRWRLHLLTRCKEGATIATQSTSGLVKDT